MLSLISNCRFPLLMLVTMRGEWAEFNSWQLRMNWPNKVLKDDISAGFTIDIVHLHAELIRAEFLSRTCAAG
jgi:sulfopyruvate decarboxylase TPP-binding subunit